MSDDAWGKIERAAEEGDARHVVDLCVELDESEKRALSKRVQALERRLAVPDHAWHGSPSRKSRARQAAAVSALLCLGPPPRRRRLFADPPDDEVERIVRSRPREWRNQWAYWVFMTEFDFAGWAVLRRLIVEGECDKPEGPAYLDRMLTLVRGRDTRRWRSGAIRDGLLADPDLLRQDVWMIFEREYQTLAGDSDWAAALIEMANEGSLPRDRLIDETLGALRRDFTPNVASSFGAFYTRLEVTPEERTERVSTYMDLLSSAVDSTVGLALRELDRADRVQIIDGRAYLEAVAPAMTIRAKGHVKRALALVKRILKRAPALATEGLGRALDALAHDAAEVQAAGLAILEAHNLDEVQRERLAGLVPLLDPSLRSRAAALAGETAQTAAGVVAVEVPDPAPIDPEAIPRLREPVTPVADLEELLALASTVLEAPDDPEQIERLLDGISRLCDQPVEEQRAAALLRRVDGELADAGQWSSTDARRNRTIIAVVLHHWLRGVPPARSLPTNRGGAAAVTRRLTALCARCAAGEPDVLLSAPTHRGAFVDPVALVTRLETAGAIADDDLALALVRLAPQKRAVALDRLGERADEAAMVVRRALGADADPPARPVLPASWDAADGGEILIVPYTETRRSVWWWHVPDETMPPQSPARLLGDLGRGLAEDAGGMGLLAIVAPGRREVFYGNLRREFSRGSFDGLGGSRFDAVVTALAPLLDPDEPIGPNAVVWLTRVLGGGGNERLAARDVVVEAISTGRLPARELGTAIAAAMLSEYAVPDRWGASLDDVPSHGPLHGLMLQRTLEATLAGLGFERPRITKVLDLLRRVVQEGDARVEDETARAWLEGAALGSSKSAKLARAILAVEGDGGARSVEAAALLEEAERERARRWA